MAAKITRPLHMAYAIAGFMGIIFLYFFANPWRSGGLPRISRFRTAAAPDLLQDISNSTLGVCRVLLKMILYQADHSRLTFQFQRVFAINLPYRTDHRDAMLLSSVASDLKIDWIDGVVDADVSEKALPYPMKKGKLNAGNTGSWRAHMNALQESVQFWSQALQRYSKY